MLRWGTLVVAMLVTAGCCSLEATTHSKQWFRVLVINESKQTLFLYHIDYSLEINPGEKHITKWIHNGNHDYSAVLRYRLIDKDGGQMAEDGTVIYYVSAFRYADDKDYYLKIYDDNHWVTWALDNPLQE
ncbi:MAG: hypothetical protein HYT03_01870 [Candidatus Harrisonbacteria bacterium]|nr:hypothetical protein [Candidatus Harrisonbacteria bacterium]